MLSRLRVQTASRWTWALVALAAIWIVLQLMAAAASLTASYAYSAFVGATPAIFAAAAMFVAPRERLVRVAALAFALPVLVQALIGGSILIATGMLSSDYAYLGERLAGAASAFGLIAWIFPIVAVFSLALYIGLPRARWPWAIVAAAAVLALLQAVTILRSTPAGVPIETTLTSVLAQLIWVAWAVLLSAAVARHMVFMAVAALSHLIAGAISIMFFVGLRDTLASDPSGPIVQALLAVLWLLGVVSWVALLVGILRELPRTSDEEARASRTKGSFSLGR